MAKIKVTTVVLFIRKTNACNTRNGKANSPFDKVPAAITPNVTEIKIENPYSLFSASVARLTKAATENK
ncbi:hypothetical protein D3C80_2169890 [compost metagenome]